MCVPGVQASASDGVRAIAAAAMMNAARKREAGRLLSGGPFTASDADALALTADCLSEIVELVFDDVVDCIPRSVHIIPNLFGDVVHWNSFNQVFTAVLREFHSFHGAGTCPARSAGGSLSRPACTLESKLARISRALAGCSQQRTKRTLAGRPASNHQGYAGSDRNSDQRRCQKVELIFALFIEVILDF